LLRADNAPLVVSFLGEVFVEGNVRGLPAGELADRLDDVLHSLNEDADPPRFPKAARAYLDDWAAPDAGWLRKYYPAGSDEPHFDATPATEKAVAWCASLRVRTFVGTESRLNTVVELLRQMVFGAETDPATRLAELERRRQQIDDEIERVRRGEVAVMDPAGQRDRYQQFAATARELLADFREVEGNFRALDRDLREQITTWNGAKGGLLEQVVAGRASIADSDQGRSFHAFYDFLLSPTRQEELAELLRRVHEPRRRPPGRSTQELRDTPPARSHLHRPVPRSTARVDRGGSSPSSSASVPRLPASYWSSCSRPVTPSRSHRETSYRPTSTRPSTEILRSPGT
jgi:flagellar motility protein MotE (MotC chaperone)